MLEGMLETALYARDLDQAETFYEDVLGLEKIARAANRHVLLPLWAWRSPDLQSRGNGKTASA